MARQILKAYQPLLMTKEYFGDNIQMATMIGGIKT
jgi:hypothetical protein